MNYRAEYRLKKDKSQELKKKRKYLWSNIRFS